VQPIDHRMRHVLHIDMNAFYCACHAAAEPSQYAGKPTAVAGNPETRHGVLVTASYEARKVGVKATMTVAEALRFCPHLILIQPDFGLYRTYSRQVFDIVRQFTPLVEIFSIDECWADLTGSSQFGTPLEMAYTIQTRVQQELHLPCSIGLGPNKFLAKMASDFLKPMGVTPLWTEDIEAKLWPLPIGHMFGIGSSTQERLNRLGVQTIRDLAHADPAKLGRLLGKRGLELIQLANGQDTSPVTSEPEPMKSIGHSITLAKDSSNMDELSTVLMNLSDQVGRRVRHHDLVGRTVQLTIRYANRETITRSKTLAEPTSLTEEVYANAKALLVANKRRDSSLRLLGVSLSQLQRPQAEQPAALQLSLFDEPLHPTSTHDTVKKEQLKKLTRVTDELRDKYGEDIVLRGRMMKSHESRQIRNRNIRGTSLQKDNLT
jgi:DNA polymerase-4